MQTLILFIMAQSPAEIGTFLLPQMTDFCVLSKHRGFNKHIWQSFGSWRAWDDTVCANNMLSLLEKQVYSIIQLIDYSQDTCYPTRENGRRTQRIRVGPGNNSRQYREPRAVLGWWQEEEAKQNTHTHPSLMGGCCMRKGVILVAHS